MKAKTPKEPSIQRIKDFLSGYDAGLRSAAKEAERVARHFKKPRRPDEPEWAETAAVAVSGAMTYLAKDLRKMQTVFK